MTDDEFGDIDDDLLAIISEIDTKKPPEVSNVNKLPLTTPKSFGFSRFLSTDNTSHLSNQNKPTSLSGSPKPYASSTSKTNSSNLSNYDQPTLSNRPKSQHNPLRSFSSLSNQQLKSSLSSPTSVNIVSKSTLTLSKPLPSSSILQPPNFGNKFKNSSVTHKQLLTQPASKPSSGNNSRSNLSSGPLDAFIQSSKGANIKPGSSFPIKDGPILISDDDFSWDDEDEAVLMETVEKIENKLPKTTSLSTPPPKFNQPVPKSSNQEPEVVVLDDIEDFSDLDSDELDLLETGPTITNTNVNNKNNPVLSNFSHQSQRQPNNFFQPSQRISNGCNPRSQAPSQFLSASTQANVLSRQMRMSFEGQYMPPVKCYETQHEYQPLEYCPEAVKSWIYPTNYPVREYQFNIVQRALHENTLVCLPTGLGKTFIAAVVMYNYFRWFPKSKVVFMAPTKPLVAQQIESCYKVCGITQEESIEMTGAIPAAIRSEHWKTKRVFYLTPQVMYNDMEEGLLSASDISCVVIDEAHRAQKLYSYVTVVKELYDKNPLIRVLALSATPGTTIDKVQSVVINLNIARIEFRTEDALDIKPYTFEKQIDKIIVPLTPTISSLMFALKSLIAPYLEKLHKLTAISITDPDSASSYQLLTARDRFRNRGTGGVDPRIAEADFALCMSFLKQLELLNVYGITTFHARLQSWVEESGPTAAKYRQAMTRNPQFIDLFNQVKSIMADPNYISEFKSHPKLGHLFSYVKRYFESQESDTLEGKSQSKVMIFVQFRETVEEIISTLTPLNPMVRPMTFIGQTNLKSGKGLKQKEQIEVISKFKKGGYNVLVSTSIGEEGLDIGEVDLIICYDSHASPIRMLQRVGRTGRRREGKICMLLTKGKEEQSLNRSSSTHKQVLKGIQKNMIMFFPDNPRMLPEGVIPECIKKPIEIPKYQPVIKSSRSRANRGGKGSQPSYELTPEEYEKYDEMFGSGISQYPSLTAYPNHQTTPGFIYQISHNKRTKLFTSIMKKCQTFQENCSFEDLPSLSFEAACGESKTVCDAIPVNKSSDAFDDSLTTVLFGDKAKKNLKTLKAPVTLPVTKEDDSMSDFSTPEDEGSNPVSSQPVSSPHMDLADDIFDLDLDEMFTDFGPNPIVNGLPISPPSKIKFNDIRGRMNLFFARVADLSTHSSNNQNSPTSFNKANNTQEVSSQLVPLDSNSPCPKELPTTDVTQPSSDKDISKSISLISSFACNQPKVLPKFSETHLLNSSGISPPEFHEKNSFGKSSDISQNKPLEFNEMEPDISQDTNDTPQQPYIMSPILLSSSPLVSTDINSTIHPVANSPESESPCIVERSRGKKRCIIEDSPSTSHYTNNDSISRLDLLVSGDCSLVESNHSQNQFKIPDQPTPKKIRLHSNKKVSSVKKVSRNIMELEAEESGDNISSDESSSEDDEVNDSFVCEDNEVVHETDSANEDPSLDMEAFYRQSIKSQADHLGGFATCPNQYGLQRAKFRYVKPKKHHKPESQHTDSESQEDSFIVDDSEPIENSDWTSSGAGSPKSNTNANPVAVLEALCDLSDE